jgi:hypothetical protein
MKISFDTIALPTPASPDGLMLARQWKVGTVIEAGELVAVKAQLAHDETRPAEADGRRLFESEAERLGGGAETAGALFGRGLPAAAEIELGASLEV